jgi:hypothetical protein
MELSKCIDWLNDILIAQNIYGRNDEIDKYLIDCANTTAETLEAYKAFQDAHITPDDLDTIEQMYADRCEELADANRRADYWEREARKHAGDAGEFKILMYELISNHLEEIRKDIMDTRTEYWDVRDDRCMQYVYDKKLKSLDKQARFLEDLLITINQWQERRKKPLPAWSKGLYDIFLKRGR